MGRTAGAARIRVQVKFALSPVVQAMNDKTLQNPASLSKKVPAFLLAKKKGENGQLDESSSTNRRQLPRVRHLLRPQRPHCPYHLSLSLFSPVSI